MQRFNTFTQFLNESQLNLFGSNEIYIERAKNLKNFEVLEISPATNHAPAEFTGVDFQADWKINGRVYTSMLLSTKTPYKDGKAILAEIEKEVIGVNKKEWKKIGTQAKYFKGDFVSAFEHSALGLMYFETMKARRSPETYRVRIGFMNAEASWGKIDNYPQLKSLVDSTFEPIKHDDNAVKAVISYLQDRYIKSRI